MQIAVWGRDGIGKSTLCSSLGALFARQEIIAVIDTDLTQPTLPIRLPEHSFKADSSLGRFFAGIGTDDITLFLNQHPKYKKLFYSGLTDQDEYLSYEIGLEVDNRAQDFVELCAETVDTIILDLSGQRTDPFVPGALIHAETILVPFTPDVQGVCWFNAVKPLLQSMKAQGRVLPVAAMTDRHQDISLIEKAIDADIGAILPFVKEFRQKHHAFPA